MIHAVVAADDPRLAAYARIGDHAWLLGGGLFVAEGRLVVERLIESGSYAIESVLVTPAALEAMRSRLEAIRADVYVAQQPVLNAVTGFKFHRGCLALARRPQPASIDSFFAARRLLILDGIGNPDNVGGLFRAAAALGADGILLDPRSADPLYRKAIRTSMAATLKVPFARVDGWPGVLGVLANQGFRIVALTPDPTARLLPDVASVLTRARVALLLGAEGEGLSADALAAAHERVRIPMAADVDSLNVVVAAAIALYGLAVRQP